MQRSTAGSFHLLRVFEIDVFLHWSWFLVAFFLISSRQPLPPAPGEEPEPVTTAFWIWRTAEYLSLFGIVLLHEFGHALACRSVGGKADTIVLWPLGGIAYVSPPPRPGALLWTIIAGPLVNLILIAPCALLMLAVDPTWWPELRHYFFILTIMNIGLFIFNMMPIYPLDGGQVVHALLWYGMGRWRSLQVASTIGGFFGLTLFMLLTVFVVIGWVDIGSVLILGLITIFIVMQSMNAYRIATYQGAIEELPKHEDCACPRCMQAPPRGRHWVCDECETRFDTFQTQGKCPACGAWYLNTTCPHCHDTHHIDRWYLHRPGVGRVHPDETV
jgi:Zn-dependent protease